VKAGDRVGAISSLDNGIAYLFGYGVYDGDFIPENAVGFLAEACREHGVKNPRIKLDSGKTVYGCECWWESEEGVKNMLAECKEVIEIDIDSMRAI
jgi:hypothetical protein